MNFRHFFSSSQSLQSPHPLSEKEGIPLTVFSTLAPVLFLSLFLTALLFTFLLPSFEKSYFQQKKELSKSLIQVQTGYLASLNRDIASGNVSLKEAQNRALDRFRTLRYGEKGNGYFWIIGPSRTLLMHPYRTDLEGLKPEIAAAPDGAALQKLISSMEKAALSAPEGEFVSYEWNLNHQLETVTSKTSFVSLFKPWNWIIGTGVYLSEAEAQFAPWRTRAVFMVVLAVLAAAAFTLLQSLRVTSLGKKAQLAEILDRSLQEQSLELAESASQLALISKVFEHASEGVVILDSDRRILRVNRAFTEIGGYSEEEVLGQRPEMFQSLKHDTEFFAEMRHSLREKGEWTGEIWNRRKNGEAFPGKLRVVVSTDASGAVNNYVGVISDLSELQFNKEQLDHERFHDRLTGLPNRFLFQDRFKVALENARRKNWLVSVIMIDLDRFSALNAALGYPAGDFALQETGRRIAEEIQADGSVARFGADEFIVLLTGPKDFQSALRVVENVLLKLREPLSFNGNSIALTISAGISLYPRDGEDPDTLISNASLSLERAKRDGGDIFRLFTRDLDQEVQQRMRLERELREGIREGRFYLNFQPVLSLGEKRITGVEALLRWKTADGAMVPPDVFIPLAEEMGEIETLGRFALEEGCRQAEAWRKKGLDLLLSVNVSPKELYNTAFVQGVLEVIKNTSMDPQRLILELTETAFMKNADGLLRMMEELGRTGIRFSLDDFGTGFSSLARLRDLPLYGMKIDRSFIQDIHGTRTRSVVATTLYLAGELSLDVTLEGVETPLQLSIIKSMLVGRIQANIQGYLLSRPVSAEQIPLLCVEPLPDAFIIAGA
ncbi:MAG: EAL domain-containing protein [Synergistaceae bacterium]|nr:EAL domain-containing protein [Synergistaceae bacterium]